jgi:hypothetical protein
MKDYRSYAVLAAFLVILGAAPVWASDPPATPKGTPAILASLDPATVTVLDDREASAIRGLGDEYRYVLVKILGLNALDFAPGIEWTWNPLGYRYGAWGGPGWTNGGRTDILVSPADPMDGLFMNHDLAVLTDQALVIGLRSLPNTSNLFWGSVYVPGSTAITPGSGLPVSANVWVSGASFVGGRVFLGWRPMPFTEYARREALTGMQLLLLLP